MFYEFHLEGMLIQADKCEKDEYDFLHLYSNGVHIANIILDTYSVSFANKTSKTISFELKRRI